MPLAKVEVLTNILIDCEYIVPPRSHRQRVVFYKRLELLGMSALHLLATGGAFQSCKVLCGISTSEVRKFFYIPIKAMVDMKDKYIYLP
jgi:hypothetical protein